MPYIVPEVRHVLSATTKDIDSMFCVIVLHSSYVCSCALRKTPHQSLALHIVSSKEDPILQASAPPSSGQTVDFPSLAQPSLSYGLQLSMPGQTSKAKLPGAQLAALTFLIDAFCRTESSYKQSISTEKQHASLGK